MPTHIMKLSIIFFVTTINNVFASFPKVKFGKFNREFGFNLTVKELNQDITFSTSDEALALASGVPEEKGINHIHENDIVVSIDNGLPVYPTEIADALQELDELLLFLRNNAKGVSTVFPRLSETSKLEGFVEMRWIDATYIQIQSKEKKRQDDVRDFRNEEALRKAQELEEERQRARRLSRESKWLNITTIFAQDKPPPHIEFEHQIIPLTVSKDVKTKPALKKGDQLVLVNEDSVLEVEKFEDVFDTIKNALWPKSLLWRRRKPLGADDIGQQLGT